MRAQSRGNCCCLPNFGRCGRRQDRVLVNCPLVERLYPAEWMAEKLFRTVDHPSGNRRHRPKLGRQQYCGNNLPPCAMVPTTWERGRHSGAMSTMDLPRAPKSSAASAVPKRLFQKSQVPHERVPRDRWASPGIVDWSHLRDSRERLSKFESVASQKRHM